MAYRDPIDQFSCVCSGASTNTNEVWDAASNTCKGPWDNHDITPPNTNALYSDTSNPMVAPSVAPRLSDGTDLPFHVEYHGCFQDDCSDTAPDRAFKELAEVQSLAECAATAWNGGYVEFALQMAEDDGEWTHWRA